MDTVSANEWAYQNIVVRAARFASRSAFANSFHGSCCKRVVVFLMHTGERVLTTNTARLAVKALPNSEIRIRGRKDERLSLADLEQDGRHSLLLYPSSHAAELNADFVAGLAGPVTLIVPDGSWGTAAPLRPTRRGLAGFPTSSCRRGLPRSIGCAFSPMRRVSVRSKLSPARLVLWKAPPLSSSSKDCCGPWSSERSGRGERFRMTSACMKSRRQRESANPRFVRIVPLAACSTRRGSSAGWPCPAGSFRRQSDDCRATTARRSSDRAEL